MKRITILTLCAIFTLISCNATKNVVDPYVGDWTYLMKDIPTVGDLKGTFKITKDGKNYVGSIYDEQGQSTPMGNLMIENGQLSTQYSANGYDIEMKGTFNNAIFTGKIDVAGYQFDVSASKQ